MGREENTDQREKHNVAVDAYEEGQAAKKDLKFYIMKIFPKDADDMSTLREVVKSFEEADQRLFQISKKTREKVVSGRTINGIFFKFF